MNRQEGEKGSRGVCLEHGCWEVAEPSAGFRWMHVGVDRQEMEVPAMALLIAIKG